MVEAEVVAMRAQKAEAKRRAAIWAALDRKSGMGWLVDEEMASRPVMPVGMSSMRWSLGTLRLGVDGLEGPEGPQWGKGERWEESRAEGDEPGGGAPGEGRKAERMWWRLRTVEARGEFWILE